jgi:hypothetical protein
MRLAAWVRISPVSTARARLLPLLLLALLPGVGVAGFATEMMGATFKLYHPQSTSTCFVLRREAPDEGIYLVTTAHTLERMKGETAIFVLREIKPDGSYERRDHTIPVRDGEKPLWVRHELHDVAVLRVKAPLPVAVSAVPVSALADDAKLDAAGVELCGQLFVLTYPERFEGNPAGLPVARSGIFATPPRLSAKQDATFLADFTAFAGDSGGPVFVRGVEGQLLIVGLVLARHHHVARMKSAYEDREVRHPLGIGTVLRASAIAEVVEMAAARGTDTAAGKSETLESAVED